MAPLLTLTWIAGARLFDLAQTLDVKVLRTSSKYNPKNPSLAVSEGKLPLAMEGDRNGFTFR
jgi:hypothetical protein